MAENAMATGRESVTGTIEGRAVISEFQDYQGTVHYWHTDARATWMPDGTSVYDFLTKETTDAQIDSVFSVEEDNTAGNNTEEGEN